MKSLQVIGMSFIISLLCDAQAFATATYDYFVDVKIVFNIPWDESTPIIKSKTLGSGQHHESSVASTDFSAQNL